MVTKNEDIPGQPKRLRFKSISIQSPSDHMSEENSYRALETKSSKDIKRKGMMHSIFSDLLEQLLR